MILQELEQPIIIAGPCAAESREQVRQTVREAKKRGISIIRACASKPRTKPGFDGYHEAAMIWLAEEVAGEGLIPATEVMIPEEVDLLRSHVERVNPQVKMLVWIGSRNQNHLIQQAIGNKVAGNEKIMLGIKNQPWPDMDHWLGIIEHVKYGIDGIGASPEQLILMHRGFAPKTPEWRNPPNLEMALEVQSITQLPLLIDPSHIAGSISKVEQMMQEAEISRLKADKIHGYILEVHPHTAKPLTDANQQLSWNDVDRILGTRGLNLLTERKRVA